MLSSFSNFPPESASQLPITAVQSVPGLGDSHCRVHRVWVQQPEYRGGYLDRQHRDNVNFPITNHRGLDCLHGAVKTSHDFESSDSKILRASDANNRSSALVKVLVATKLSSRSSLLIYSERTRSDWKLTNNPISEKQRFQTRVLIGCALNCAVSQSGLTFQYSTFDAGRSNNILQYLL